MRYAKLRQRDLVMLAENFTEAHHNDQDYYAVSGHDGVFLISMTLPANFDSVYVTVRAQNTAVRYNWHMNFMKRASWSKWVHIVD